ncbi:hypothetical protein KDX38_22445 [Pseudomonas sp. CDFA 602]|uniref:hypothetical protein n=1 Tax=Pseudomonas californiensis TaxID=2829823 RepID=UPI001E50004D|nr:hypothetical protein [Pseudomonas californiensis]MCD5996358.1 hypothetical protein [Pseudomonas californiensis]MCD6001957.1 hypothetical protein [Pseudomonas californiensis]
MNPLTILTASFRLLLGNVGIIALFYLPLLVLEMCISALVRSHAAVDTEWVYQSLIVVVIAPIYTGYLILALETRSSGDRPSCADLLRNTLPVWPALAVLSAVDQLLIILVTLPFLWGARWETLILSSVEYVSPGMWLLLRLLVAGLAFTVLIRLIFDQCLVVLKARTTVAAMRKSIDLSREHIGRIAGCALWMTLPLLAITALVFGLRPDWMEGLIASFEQNSPATLTLLSVFAAFIRLFTTIVIFCLFKRIGQQAST